MGPIGPPVCFKAFLIKFTILIRVLLGHVGNEDVKERLVLRVYEALMEYPDPQVNRVLLGNLVLLGFPGTLGIKEIKVPLVPKVLLVYKALEENLDDPVNYPS